MKINKEKTRQYFSDAVEKKHLDFLRERDVISKGYIKALKEGQYGMLENNCIYINGEEYIVTYILGASKESIYDLIRVNQFFDLPPEQGTAFAILLGDDFLFFKPYDETVYFFCRDTEEEFVVAEDYNSFMDLSCIKEEK